MFERLKQQNNSVAPQLSQELLLNMIIIANTDPKKLVSEDDAEIDNTIPDHLVNAVKELSSDCSNYHEFQTLKRKFITNVALLSVTTAIGALQLSQLDTNSNIPAPVSCVPTAIFGAYAFFTTIFSFMNLSDQLDLSFSNSSKERVVANLQILNLPLEFIEKNFPKIIEVMDKKNQELETNIKLEEARSRLGLPTTPEINLQTILVDQEHHNNNG